MRVARVCMRGQGRVCVDRDARAWPRAHVRGRKLRGKDVDSEPDG